MDFQKVALYHKNDSLDCVEHKNSGSQREDDWNSRIQLDKLINELILDQ